MPTLLIRNLHALSPIDHVLLAIAQIIQPADKTAIFESLKGNVAGESLDEETFKKHFKFLEKSKLFWRTSDNKYIVTEEGDLYARASLKRNARDKLRLLYLNKKRYCEN